jgi:hypothetical protein
MVEPYLHSPICFYGVVFKATTWGALESSTVAPAITASHKEETPIRVAERSEARTVFARSDNGIVGSNPTKAWMFVYVYSVFVLGSDLATG